MLFSLHLIFLISSTDCHRINRILYREYNSWYCLYFSAHFFFYGVIFIILVLFPFWPSLSLCRTFFTYILISIPFTFFLKFLSTCSTFFNYPCSNYILILILYLIHFLFLILHLILVLFSFFFLFLFFSFSSP